MDFIISVGFCYLAKKKLHRDMNMGYKAFKIENNVKQKGGKKPTLKPKMEQMLVMGILGTLVKWNSLEK